VFITSKVLFEAREVRHAGVESLHRRVGAVDGVVTCLLSELDHFEKDEVSDAGVCTTEEVLRGQAINQRFHLVHERLDGDRLVISLEASFETGGAAFVDDALECKPSSALFGSGSEDSRAERSSNVLMDGQGL